MLKLVEDEVFKTVHVIDYQAVCFREKKVTNPASTIRTVCFIAKIYFCIVFVYSKTYALTPEPQDFLQTKTKRKNKLSYTCLIYSQ